MDIEAQAATLASILLIHLPSLT